MLANKFLTLGVFACLFVTVMASFVSAARFDVSETDLHGVVMSGDKYEYAFTISSLDSQSVSLSLENAKWASVEPKFVVLGQNDMKEVKITFDSFELEPGVYIGTLKITSTSYEIVLPLIFEVESRDVVVDGSLDIPPQYKTIYLGDRLLAQLRIYDLIDFGDTTTGTKVSVNYKIVSLDGKTIASDDESVTFTKSIQVSKSVLFSDSVVPGKYVLEANIKYGPSIASSTALFEIKKKSFSDLIKSDTLLRKIVNWVLIVLGVALLWFIIVQIREIFRLGVIEKQSQLKDRVKSILGT
jgi:hypothetical protein